MNKRGVTLTEVVIACLLFALLVPLMGKLVGGIFGSYSQSKRVFSLQTNGRDALTMMSREIKNTGCKTYMTQTSGVWTRKSVSAIFSDSSSFIHTESNKGDSIPGDKLQFLTISLDHAGNYLGVDTIQYYLKQDTLVRKQGQNKITNCAINIRALKFIYGVLAADSVLLSQPSFTSIASWTKSTNCTLDTFGGKQLRITPTATGSGYAQYATAIKITSDQRVAISFKLDMSGSLNLDSIRWSFLSGTTLLGCERFKPSPVNNRIVLPVKANNNAKLTLEYWCSGTGGAISLASVEARRMDKGSYTWVSNPDNLTKKSVKAVHIYLLARSATKSKFAQNNKIIIGKDTINRYDNYTWRIYDEMVEIANNGLK